MRDFFRQKRPLVIGHRGYPLRETENTLPSIRRAIEAGADGVELDVRMTRDGVPVIFHDREMSRLGGLAASVEELSLREVRQVTLRGGGVVPTLEEALEAAGETFLNLEVKTPGAWRECLSILQRRHRGGPLLISTFNVEDLEALSRECPSAHRGLLVRSADAEAVRKARELGCISLHVKRSTFADDLVPRVREADLFLFVYTVNERGEFTRLVRMGVDGFFTDDPGAMVSWKRDLSR